ncbi:MAG: heme ABC transporter ATP-binding protein [Clostridiales bacterium]|nr:heme ABC transporter ATP-binding protein [Clostridiales bacterium]
MLEIEKATFRYGERAVLNDISAAFRPGEVAGVIGPNGSGKSTLIRLLAGELKPAAGRVLLDGAPLARLRVAEVARRIALVPQHSRASFEFTALDVVLMGRTPYLGRFGVETERDRTLAIRAMERLGVAPLADRPASHISGGEWQRVVVARALCQDTPVMLLDEPVSSLDIRHQLDVMALMRALAQDAGKAIVCVLHDLNLAAHYCDRLALMSAGRIEYAGAPGDVLTEAAIARVYGVLTRVRREAGGLFVEPIYEAAG